MKGKKGPKPNLVITVKGLEKTGKTIVGHAIAIYLRNIYGFEVQTDGLDDRVGGPTPIEDLMKSLATKGPIRIREKVKR